MSGTASRCFYFFKEFLRLPTPFIEHGDNCRFSNPRADIKRLIEKDACCLFPECRAVELICLENFIKKWDPRSGDLLPNGLGGRSFLGNILARDPKLVQEWKLFSNTPTIVPSGFSEKECEGNISRSMLTKIASTIPAIASSPKREKILNAVWDDNAKDGSNEFASRDESSSISIGHIRWRYEQYSMILNMVSHKYE